MNKFIIKFLTVFLFLALVSCSYKPIFSEKKYNFEINEVSFIGEKNINKIIKNNLNILKRNNDDFNDKKKYNLLIKSNQKKEIVSKDTKGDPLKFEFTLRTYFEISDEKNLLLKKTVVKSNLYNNVTDKFELERNEKIILQNLSEKISEIVISSIMNLNDN